tara:strand:- start:68 stop:343 length:276 start_codon:yes stop_codon:yes gene_type:complete
MHVQQIQNNNNSRKQIVVRMTRWRLKQIDSQQQHSQQQQQQQQQNTTTTTTLTYKHFSTQTCCSKNVAIFMALLALRSIRNGNVLMPRNVK